MSTEPITVHNEDELHAEPRWSANRLEEVLRDGLPDQNAEPEAQS